MTESSLVPVERIESAILVLRGHKVLLDEELARLYGVETKALNRAVKRNRGRFPADFVFQLTEQEVAALRFRFGTSKPGEGASKSQIGTSNGRGGRRYLPYAFTQEGVAMLSSVLRSPRAVQVNVEIMRAFVRLRQMLLANAELSRKLAALEKRYDAQFRVVFEAIRSLMEPPEKPARRIGFGEE